MPAVQTRKVDVVRLYGCCTDVVRENGPCVMLIVMVAIMVKLRCGADTDGAIEDAVSYYNAADAADDDCNLENITKTMVITILLMLMMLLLLLLVAILVLMLQNRGYVDWA